jgi:hypothetical protein
LSTGSAGLRLYPSMRATRNKTVIQFVIDEQASKGGMPGQRA